jgi:hypothetical protein
MPQELKLLPVSQYLPPKYPTRQDVFSSPDLLRVVPRRWDAKPAVCAALSLTLATGLFGCAGKTTDQNTNLTGAASSSETSISTATEPTAKPGNKVRKTNLQIPIFSHGVGRGFYGCAAVAPPLFLSEDEALQVIREEAEAWGVHFDDTLAIEGSQFPATSQDPGSHALWTWEGTLMLDGYDSDLGIGFEFVSEEDVASWDHSKVSGGILENIDIKGTAERLSQVVENVAVFYDPGTNYRKPEPGQQQTDEPLMNDPKEFFKESLREQVRDFLAWLAAEGII